VISPHAALAAIEAFDGIAFPAGLVSELWRTGEAWRGRPLLASTPSFKTYASDEIGCATAGAYPAFSITGTTCALQCGHCRGRILDPMLPAPAPEALERQVRAIAARQGLRGFLLSGGSSRRNEVPFERFLPAVKRLKAELPGIEVAVHTGLVDERRAAALAEAGIDVAMLDIIGDAETIREVYNLGRPVADFEASLAHLVAAGLDVVPHVVIGLHFGRLRGERAALDIISRYPTRAAIMVVLMTHLADERFAEPEIGDIGRTFAAARSLLADRQLLLGCARPHGVKRRIIDAFAVLAGLDAIAHPADGAVTLARALGREVGVSGSCCGTSGCHRAA
jgi:uncharacterized radical SAM superfamily protein